MSTNSSKFIFARFRQIDLAIAMNSAVSEFGCNFCGGPSFPYRNTQSSSDDSSSETTFFGGIVMEEKEGVGGVGERDGNDEMRVKLSHGGKEFTLTLWLIIIL